MNGIIRPGIKSEPSTNNIVTTDGIKMESKIDPIISIIIPTFDSSRFIEKTINELYSFLLESNISKFEIIIVCDSRDNENWRIIKDLKKKRIQYIFRFFDVSYQSNPL